MSKYRIYPSLMDAYEWMQAADDEAAYIQRRDDLLAKLNRIKQEPPYAASRGTALNEVIDTLLTFGRVEVNDFGDHAYYIHEVDGFHFEFDTQFVEDVKARLQGMITQPQLQATIQTDHGEVELYGYADYVGGDRVVDLKTTSNYTAGKYRGHWQHRVYPYCLVKGGLVESVSEFTYLVAELREGRDGAIDGTIYTESYHIPIADCEREIRQSLDSGLLAFIEDHRGEITDTRVFGK